MKSGRDVGKEHLATLEAFIKSGATPPLGRDGGVNLTELEKLTGIPRSSFYQNPAVKSLIRQVWQPKAPSASPTPEEGAGQVDAASTNVEERKSQRLERRVQALEQQNAALVAEAYELRRQVKELRQQLGREDMTIDTGRRVPRPETTPS